MSQLAKLVAILYLFAGSLAVLCWSAGDAGIGTPFVDPVAKVHAEEEGLYGAAAFSGGAHHSRPVLSWAQALCANLFGPGVWALRLPSLLAGAGTATLVFAWLLFETDELFGALTGAVLILSSHLFFSMSRIGVPDAPLMLWITAAMFTMSRKPRWGWWLALAAVVPWIFSNWPLGWSTPSALARFMVLDPFLLAASALALIWKGPRLLLTWVFAAFAGGLVFHDRHGANLLPALPALAILAAGAIPAARTKWALGVAAALFAGKLWALAQPWGIPWEPEFINPSQTALARYAALHRGNELIVVEPDDQFYSACLGLSGVSYVYTRPPPEDLRKWGFEPIVVPSDDSLSSLMREHPEADLFLPSSLLLRDQGVHQTFPMRGARAFLLSRKMIHRP